VVFGLVRRDRRGREMEIGAIGVMIDCLNRAEERERLRAEMSFREPAASMPVSPGPQSLASLQP